MARASVLLISREPPLVESIRSTVESVGGCRLKVFSGVAEALVQLGQPDVALVLYHAGESDAIEEAAWLLEELAASQRALATIVIDDLCQPERTLKVLRLGAADCLSRPLDLRRMAFLIDSLTLRARCRIAQKPEPAAEELPSDGEFICCHSPAMLQIAKRLRQVAPQETTILFSGETGVGKTRLARLVHELSPRRAEPFLAVNCAALPENLLESELFGHRKGAFTGADADRIGKFAAAEKGTLFLDEIDSLPLAAQGKLLRVVDERVFEQVGGNRSFRFQGRLLVATNRDLEAEVAAGRFRSDLYFRLNVIELRIPPLRERRPAIRVIAEHAAREFAARNGRPEPALASEVVDVLERYDWPGNIRELRNAIERALAFCSDGLVRIEDLPDGLQQFAMQLREETAAGNVGRDNVLRLDPAASSDPPPASVEESSLFVAGMNLSTLARARVKGEIKRILEALEAAGNNRTRAARELGISRVALYKKLHKYGLMDATGG